MTQHELIIDAFRKRNWTATLGELLHEGQYTFAYKFTARVSELRKQGYTIIYERAKSGVPSEGIYKMIPPKGEVKYDTDESGQMLFV